MHQPIHNRDEFFRRVMAEEVADFFGLQPALIDQLDVFVDADIKQMRQQADVLAQGQGAIRFGGAPGWVVEMPALAIGAQPQLHTNGIVARERALVHPFQANAQAGRNWQALLLIAAQEHGASAIGQHPAQEMRVKIGIVILRRKARTLKQAGRHFAGHSDPRAVRAQLYALRHRLDGGYASGANAMYGAGFHRRRSKLALNHVGETRHQGIAARRAAGEQRDVLLPKLGIGQALAYGVGCQGRIGVRGRALRIQCVIALLDAVFIQDALFDTPRNAIQRRDKIIHAHIVHGLTRQKVSGIAEINMLKSDRHGSRFLWGMWLGRSG